MASIERIADIFVDAQDASINHKSLTKRLRRVEAQNENNRSRFEEQVKACAIRCLEVTKSEKAGQNTIKFLCSYCAATQNQEHESEEEDGTNITNQIMVVLLPYMSVKDKVIRYRATQIVSQLMGIVQEIEDELYQAIRHELGKRVRDKVPAIRLEAVCALGRLLENEMDEEAQAAEKERDEDEEMLDEDEEPESTGLLDKLLNVLQNDTNAEVRRALLLNLPIEPKTLPYLLERARDKDAGDFRHLSLSMREKLLRWGLRDRDERVRKAAVKMFATMWIEQIARTLQQTDADQEETLPKLKKGEYYKADTVALVELLERIDILNAGQDDGVGLEAMKEFWSLRPDYFRVVSFEDSFWTDLSAESAFMARSFYDYCSKNPNAQRQAEDDQKFPEVTRFGFHLQRELNRALELRGSVEEEVEEETLAEQDFIAEQLLHIAHTLDYTDEIGRRKMHGLLRQMLSVPDLPDEITRLAIETLRLTCTSDVAGEKEFIFVVQEAIAEVHDSLNDNEDEEQDNGTNREQSPADDESFVSAHSELSTRSDATARRKPSKLDKKLAKMTPEEQEDYQLRTLLVQLKCLNIAHTMLQNITSDFSTNVSLETMLNTLIIPAIQSREAPLRERAIECLGLACLLSPSLAHDNHEMFVYCMKKGHEELRMQCLKILCDCAVTHNKDGGLDLKPFVEAFGYSAEVQLCATTCIAKLMMCGFYKPALKTAEGGEEQEQEGEGDEAVEVFENAIEEATQCGTRGCELLAKVKAALVADAQGKGQVEGDRRQS
ncbi:chromosome condensation complex Condensin, subunit G [Exophiala xenobiotica]|uniref:Chromosome condensation complex Condensin, subunit G n=1 Tax=Lithohypha guttulata TaxID=1690604 RepID=A0ABR0K675_9EURO|nr:chromosome condensation complex Condensin, subunit G [Lithohypha guttulata]KAK5324341.1 chromosome condensation complex Condensin, subunit G [Exophiala xenobiotica]